MTNLIEKIREMQEVGDFVATTAEMDTLLAALGKVQAGDAKILAEILSFIESEATESDWEDAIGLLRRYADLARLMEATR